MVLASDIESRGFERVRIYEWNSLEKVDPGKSRYLLRCSTNKDTRDSEVRIQEYIKNKDNWQLKTLFDGTIYSPVDLHTVFKLVGIINVPHEKGIE